MEDINISSFKRKLLMENVDSLLQKAMDYVAQNGDVEADELADALGIDISMAKSLIMSLEKDNQNGYSNAEDNLYKKVTGEEPKASTKNKFRDLKEGNYKDLDKLKGKIIQKISDDGGLKIFFEDGTTFEAFVMDQGDTGLTYLVNGKRINF